MLFLEKNCNTYMVNIMRFYAPNKNKVSKIISPGTVKPFYEANQGL